MTETQSRCLAGNYDFTFNTIKLLVKKINKSVGRYNFNINIEIYFSIKLAQSYTLRIRISSFLGIQYIEILFYISLTCTAVVASFVVDKFVICDFNCLKYKHIEDILSLI